jgi:peptidoglycan/xylan/chitin deacetylase (PgdA/CDA1 family)
MDVIVRPLKVAARSVGVRRAHVARARLRAERELLATAAKRRPAPHGRILCYHSIGTPRWGVNDVSAERFTEQLELALQLGYRFVSAAAVAEGRAGADDIALTFDDGVLSAATAAAPILAEYGVPWTLFVVAGWADGRHSFDPGIVMGWQEVERLAAQGVEIGSHSMTHPDFGSLSEPEARRELLSSRELIESRVGIHVTSFAIPMGQSANWSAAAGIAAIDAGYELVYAQSVLTRPPGTVPRTFITRFDDRRIFAAALRGAFDGWEEWV